MNTPQAITANPVKSIFDAADEVKELPREKPKTGMYVRRNGKEVFVERKKK